MSDSEKNKEDSFPVLDYNDIIMLCITHDGNIIMLSTGDFTPIQTSIAEKILTVVGDHSLIFKLFLCLEILFSKLSYRISALFRRN